MPVGLARTPDGRRIEVTRRIDAPRAVVWDLFTDTERWPEWGPSVRAVDCERRYIDEGTTGRVRTIGGLWLPFRIERCVDHRWTWRVAGVPATGHRVDAVGAVDDAGGGQDEERGDGDAEESGRTACRAVFEVCPLAAGYVPVCQRALTALERIAVSRR